MDSTSSPVLVYNRIDENRRNTLLLLPAFVVLLLPVAYGLTQLLVPFSFYRTHVVLGGAQARLNLASMEASTLRTVMLALVLAACVAFLGYLVSTYFVLRQAGGHRVDRGEEPVLCRTVENLSIGAGLPQPAVYVVDSSTPNAFSTGRDPRHASIIVTRGLLRLLDERELRGVLAHELSHIGNRDTGLSSLLAALVATLRLPLSALSGFVNSIFRRNPLGSVVMGFGVILLVVFVPTIVVWSMWARHQDGMPLTIREVVTIVAPLYAFFIAPAAGVFVRKTIVHQREFLADADAVLLTRDPEALALALAKVSAATGSSLRAGVATAHFYFLDPLPHMHSWLDSTFPSHPPVHARIALLARMGDGIPERSLLEATEEGTAHVLPSASRPSGARESVAYESGAKLRLADSRTLLYKSAEASSAVLADLDANVLVTVVDRDAQFIRVRLADGLAGYIPISTALMTSDNTENDDAGGVVHHRMSPAAAFDERTVPATRFRLTDRVTPLYEKPDGWSRVALELASGTVVTFNELVGHFARVNVDGTAGYIPLITGADSIGPERSHA
jgi:heat shock protein HtpX